MTCASCAGRIEKALSRLPGVEASVNLATETADIHYSPAALGPTELVETIEAAGYEVPLDHWELEIGGMTCAACSGRVERILARAAGVVKAEVNSVTERARIEGVAGALHAADLIARLDDAGYRAVLVSGSAGKTQDFQAAEAREARQDLYFVAALAVLTVPLLLPMIGIDLPVGLQLILAAPVQFIGGGRFYAAAWRALRAGSGNMELLVSLGTSAGFFFSLYTFIMGSGGPTYFEAAAVVITLTRFGKWLERRAKRVAASEIREMMSSQPATARVLRDDREFEIPVEAVSTGDIVLVRPGERIATDGLVLSGKSHADESLLTGESFPIEKQPGDRVLGGSINGGGLLRIETTRVGAQSTLSRILAHVETMQAKKAPAQRLADAVAAVFVPVVLVCALASLVLWGVVRGDLSGGWVAAVAVLVAACPCSLGLATPTALAVGTGVAARAGILFRDIEALERLRQVDIVVFDKTGTLTAGEPIVTDVIGNGRSEAKLLALAAAAQTGSEHPLARAVLKRAEGMARARLDSFEARPGSGLVARVDGQEIVIGTAALLSAHGIAPALEDDALRLARLGRTLMWIAAVDPEPVVLGLIAVADTMKPTAVEAVTRLQTAGIEIMLLTGDNRHTAKAIADALGIGRVCAEMLPEDKAREIESLQRQGRRVAMVGDGVNDAPALARADVGIAMGTGADVAMETADVTLLRGDPLLVAEAVMISRATCRKIRENLFWAFGYNVIALPLAMLGLLNPMIAGAAMAFSSVAVVGNALLLRRWRPGLPPRPFSES